MIVALCSFYLLLCCGSSRPNILWIIADDFGYNDLGIHNQKNQADVLTPHLDALATGPHGILFENAYSQPICSPTRSQLLSGRYQIHTGLQHGVIWPTQANGLPLNETTIAQQLQKVDYATHAIGKWHVGFFTKEHTPTYRGFDSFFGFWGGGEDYLTHVAGGAFDFRENESLYRSAVGHYSTQLFSERAVSIIENHTSVQPLFIYLAYQATHAPLQAPQQYIDQCMHVHDESRRTFCGMALAMDEGIANVTSALKRTGLYSNTVIMFTGDNGGQIHAGGNNWPLRGWKGSLWEGGLRASSFIHSPLLPVNAPTVWKGLIHVSDWYATACALAQAPCNVATLDGYNVWNALVENSTSPRSWLLHEIDHLSLQGFQCAGPIASLHHGHNNGTWSFPPPLQGTYRRAALRDGRFKIIVGSCAAWDNTAGQVEGSFAPARIAPPGYVPPAPHRLGSDCRNVTLGQTLWLFDIESDPVEECDLSLARPGLVQQLLTRLKSLNATGVPCRFPDADPQADPSLHNDTWTYWKSSSLSSNVYI